MTPIPITTVPWKSGSRMINAGVEGATYWLSVACGQRPELQHSKQIFRFTGAISAAVSFSTCSATTFDTVVFLLTCNSQLATVDGSDINTKGCTCQWNDDGCGLGSRLDGLLERYKW
jgi:hypothetical protein